MRFFVVFLLFMCTVLAANAQLRRAKGVSAVDVQGIYLNSTVGGQAGYLYHFSSKFAGRAGLAYSSPSLVALEGLPEVKYTNLYLDLSAYWTPVRLGESIFLTAVFGPSVGYESVNSTLVTNTSAFVLGGNVGIEAELFLGERFSFVLGGTQRMYAKSDLGNRIQFNGGFRLNF